MIINNATNVVIYGDDWTLESDAAYSKSGTTRDRSVNTSNSTFVDVQVPLSFVPGDWVYIEGEFSYSVEGLKKAIEYASTVAKDIRDGLIFGGLVYQGNTFKTDPVAVAEVDSVSARYTLGRDGWKTEADWQTRHNGRWRTTDNHFAEMTLEEFHGLAEFTAEHITKISQRAHDVKDTLLPSCKTQEEIDKVISDFREYTPTS